MYRTGLGSMHDSSLVGLCAVGVVRVSPTRVHPVHALTKFALAAVVSQPLVSPFLSEVCFIRVLLPVRGPSLKGRQFHGTLGTGRGCPRGSGAPTAALNASVFHGTLGFDRGRDSGAATTAFHRAPVFVKPRKMSLLMISVAV